jgi:ABC-2 type transport system permease protein
MNTQANSLPESFGSQGTTPATFSAPRPMYWSIRRELWENRYLYIAPLAVAGFAVAGFLVATIGRALSTSNLAQRRAILEEPYHFTTAIIMGTAFVAGLIYCLDALHGERRDRSILFWKSLPVSDLTTVLSKASIPIVLVPALSFVLTLAAHWIMLVLSTAVLRASGMSAGALWAQVGSSERLLLYHLVTVHMLWYAPIYAWLLLVSGWARRAVFLWAGLPALAIYTVEKLVFNSSHFAALLKYRFSGPEDFAFTEPGSRALHAMMHHNLAEFLSTPGLWTGLLAAAIFLAAAVRLRRYQAPI